MVHRKHCIRIRLCLFFLYTEVIGEKKKLHVKDALFLSRPKKVSNIFCLKSGFLATLRCGNGNSELFVAIETYKTQR